MHRTTAKKTVDSPKPKPKGRAKLKIPENCQTLETCFAQAAFEYICVICGDKVKSGLRRTHERNCKVLSDDDGIIFVDEKKAVQQPTVVDDEECSILDIVAASAQPQRPQFHQIPAKNSTTQPSAHASSSRRRLKRLRSSDTSAVEPWLKRSRTMVNVVVAASEDTTEADGSDQEIMAPETNGYDKQIIAPEANDIERSTTPYLADEHSNMDHSRIQSPGAIATKSSVDFFDSSVDGNCQDEITSWINGIQPTPSKMPFPLKAFTDIIKRVSNDEFHAHLFNDDDRDLISAILGLTDDARLLIIRLIMRKRAWIPVASLRLNYGDQFDLNSALFEVRSLKMVDEDVQWDNIREIMNALSAPQLQAIAKTWLKGSAQWPKPQLIDDLLKHGKRQRSLTGSMYETLRKRCKNELGSCIRLSDGVYMLLLCILHLFSPKEMSPSNIGDRRAESVASIISNLIYLLGEKAAEKLTFASRTGTREMHPFQSRKELTEYVEAKISEIQMVKDFCDKKYVSCEGRNEEVMEKLRSILDQGEDRFLEQRPAHLRVFTTPWVLFRIARYGVEALEKRKKYQAAVGQYRELIRLSENGWCQALRSMWYQRLALNLDKHLKKPDKAIKVIDQAMQEEALAEDVRRALQEREKKILQSLVAKSKKKSDPGYRLNTLMRILDRIKVPQNTITLETLGKALGTRASTIFASQDYTDGSVTARNVEEAAKEYYLKQYGFKEGIHGEGSPWMLLCGLLLWDIINDSSIPDAFMSSQQGEPADMNEPGFYISRKAQIDDRLAWIKKADIKDLVAKLRDTWTNWYGVKCSLVAWDRWNFDQVERMVKCIDGRILSQVIKHLVRNFRQRRSGFPDLLLWNSRFFTFMVVEVKGPGDCLSARQRLWLEFFVKIGAPTEVCWVKGKSGKRVQRVESVSDDQVIEDII